MTQFLLSLNAFVKLCDANQIGINVNCGQEDIEYCQQRNYCLANFWIVFPLATVQTQRQPQQVQPQQQQGQHLQPHLRGRQQDPRPSPPTLETHSPLRLPTKAT